MFLFETNEPLTEEEMNNPCEGIDELLYLDLETAKSVFDLLKKQINANRLIIFATHNRFFAKKADCMLEIVNGNIKTINARV